MRIIEITEYQVKLTFPPLSKRQTSKLEKVVAERLFNAKVASGVLEFEYAGRDTDRRMLGFLREIAAIIGTAEGVIRCGMAIVDDDGDHEEYANFKIQGGKLVELNEEPVEFAVNI